ncbi:MAG: CHASE2 domain-containing protein [Verrucomicrobiae bacterium]|nr:CHASE2 domain-containing protein [Verrucomicrobiae bacterium]
MSRPPQVPEPDPTNTSHGPERQEVMTLVFTDLVGSTRLKEELGNSEALRLILEHHRLVRDLLREYQGGLEVSTSGDSFFLAFRRPSDAVAFSLRLQARLHAWNREAGRPVQDRVGVHAGEVTVEANAQGGIHDLHGLEVDKCARVMSLAQGGQVLLTRFAFENARAGLKGTPIPQVDRVEWASHGHYQLKGVAEPIEICEVTDPGRAPLEAPADSDKVKRVAVAEEPEEEEATGWRRWLVGRRVSRRLAWIGAAVSVLVGWAGVMVPGIVEASYDWGYLFRKTEVPTEAAIVRMDSESHDELGQPWLQQWDRRVHAALIDRLAEMGARCVVFDVLFDLPAEDPGQDQAFIEAAKRFGKVVVAGVLQAEERPEIFLGHRTQGPIPEIEEVAVWGLVERAGADRTIRRPGREVELKESLSSAVMQVLGERGGVAPRNPWLNYYGPAGTVPSHPYSAVLGGRIDPTSLSNRVVFVGAVYDLPFTGGKGTDDFLTPYNRFSKSERRSAGVEIVATATLNRMRGDWLRLPTPWMQLSLVTVLGGVAGFGLCFLRPLPALILAVGAGTVVGLLAMTSVWVTQIWFPWLAFSAVQLPLALGWSVVAWAQVTGRRASLRTEGTK